MSNKTKEVVYNLNVFNSHSILVNKHLFIMHHGLTTVS